ncbi:RNA-binding protein rnp24 [Kwoniella heveanensis BCC8398]|uniref:RNA-binding protein rnp24 n=1 Tax=Kwoniella heveanensis BCC8398 TaxID=1296120 RepID=A0A1B9GRT6_9TREE|nr:RNA-binding protein rnp24 [Kwoniella heveanensis BCC8398]
MSSEGASSSKSGKVKSGRTPEQQAARDARKAAKAAAKAAAPAEPAQSATSVTNQAEPKEAGASTRVEAEVTQEQEKEGEPSKKRKRVQVVPEGEELEIDVAAPAPLSKAELRAQKKRLKRGDAEPEKPIVREYEKPSKPAPKEHSKRDGGEVDLEGGEGGKPVGPGGKRQNSVWVGNLAFKTTVETLTDFFQRGVTELGGQGAGCITRINMPKKPGKGGYAENKGFAYVDFVSPEMQELAVALSERPYEGRRLLIKKGDDHTALPTARTPKPLSTKAEDLGSSSKGRPETSSLYFGNLPFDATEQGLRDLVEGNAVEREGAELDEGAESIGERGGKKSGLKKVRLGAFEDTGRCKGFAFLDFLSSRHAKSALANRKNHFYGGRKLTVEFASEAAAQRSGGRSKPRTDAPPKPRKFYSAPDGDGEGETGAAAGVGGEGEGEEPKRNDKRGKKWEVTGRPRPGAALAMAKRENVAIVEGAGKKITFD